MNMFKYIIPFLILLSSCAVKFPNKPCPQKVSKIYILGIDTTKWTGQFFSNQLLPLLKKHKVDYKIAGITRVFLDNNPQKNEQQKAKDIARFKPHVIMEIEAWNFAENGNIVDLNNTSNSGKLINRARVSANLSLPNQYIKVWHTIIVETDPNIKLNSAEAALKKAAERLVEKMVADKIIKP
jgi:hypothetical protein